MKESEYKRRRESTSEGKCVSGGRCVNQLVYIFI